MTGRFISIACAVALSFAGQCVAVLAADVAPLGSPLQTVPTLAPLVERVTPAVVNIAVLSQEPAPDNPLLQDPFFRRFFEQPGTPPQQQRQRVSVGSGVVVDAKQGYVMTNHHVIQNAQQIVVTLRDRRSFEATKVGSDAATDIAILKISADRLTDLPLADSDKLKVGDFVLAIGNPFGLGQTVTSGIVSAVGRHGLNVEGYEDFIQTDASINPGNSGGALVNLRGELVGINTAIIGPSGGNVGIGFAVPTNIARAVMQQLVAHGEVRRGRLGVAIQDLTPEIAAALGIDPQEGAVVTAVDKGSPADQAGLQVGDVIVAVDSRSVRGASDLRNRIGLTALGKSVTLTLFREKRRMEVPVQIGPAPAASRVEGEPGKVSPFDGATLRDARPDENGMGGVLVDRVEPGSPAVEIGLRAGDRIVGFNRHRVGSMEDLERLRNATAGAIALTILRNGSARLIIIQ